MPFFLLYQENVLIKYSTSQNARVVGISVDSKWWHLAFSEHSHFYFLLFEDFKDKDAVARLYDAYDDATGECQCALYVPDEKGIIRCSNLSSFRINRGADGLQNAMEKLSQLEPIIQ